MSGLITYMVEMGTDYDALYGAAECSADPIGEEGQEVEEAIAGEGWTIEEEPRHDGVRTSHKVWVCRRPDGARMLVAGDWDGLNACAVEA